MKRILTILLSIAILLTFSGCSLLTPLKYADIIDMLEEKDFDGAREAIDKLETKWEEEEMTEEDRLQIRYDAAYAGLQEYLETGSCTIAETGEILSGEEAATYLYEEFTALEDFLDSDEIASHFGSTPSRLVEIQYTNTDNLDNEYTRTLCTYEYDAFGRLSVTDCPEVLEYYGYYCYSSQDTMHLEYDDNDVVTSITVYDVFDDVCAKITLVYNEAGQLIQTELAGNRGNHVCEFTYDDNGNRVTGQVYNNFYDNVDDITYTYDDQNRLTRWQYQNATWDDIIRKDYTYDENGVLISLVRQGGTKSNPDRDFLHTWTYEYDAEGVLLGYTVVPDREEAGFAKEVYTYIYEGGFGYQP